MSYKERFSEDEQALLGSLPTLIGTVMSMAEGSGIGTIKEMMSSAKSLVTGAATFSGNELITGIMPQLQSMKDAMANSTDMRNKMQDYLKKHEVKSKEELRTHVIEDCAKVNALLQTKSTPEEANQYKQWVLDLAENVSKAASEGGFLGFGGTQVSEGEKTFFKDIASSLQINRAL